MKKTRKITILAAVLAVCLLVSGCGKKDKGESGVSSGAAPESESVSGSASPGESAASGTADSAVSAVSSSVPEPEPVSMQGEFWDLNPERYPDERAPLLALQPDGSFTLRLNAGDGLALLSGGYERLGSALTLTITAQDTTDYLGSDILALTFDVLDEDHFRYTGQPVGMSRPGDQFTRDGMPDLEEPEPEPAPPPEPSAPAGSEAADAPASGAASASL